MAVASVAVAAVRELILRVLGHTTAKEDANQVLIDSARVVAFWCGRNGQVVTFSRVNYYGPLLHLVR